MLPVGYRGAAKMVPVPDEKRAIELVRKRVPVNEGELAKPLLKWRRTNLSAAT